MSAPPSDPIRRVAVLGTGIMGSPMASHLRRAGHDVRVWDIEPDRLRALGDDGITACPSATAAVQSADVVITMVTDVDAVVSIMGGSSGPLAGFDGLWLQTTTVGIEGTRSLADLAAAFDVAFVDVPLLGTRSSAEAAALTALASGPPTAESTTRSLLSAFCTRVLWLGEAGRGSRLKLVMNGWVLGLTTLTAETIALASGLGLEPTAFLDIVRGGPLDVEQAHIKGRAMVEGDFTPALPLRLAAKDADLIVAAGIEAGVDLAVGRAVSAQLATALAEGHGDEDVAAVWFSTGAVIPPERVSGTAATQETKP